AALAGRLAALTVGDGLLPGVDVGPLVTGTARDEVAAEIDRALAGGCELVARTPRVPAAGHYVAPTLLSAADQRPRICREEVFGPVSVLLRARDADEAFALAADTRFGLTAAVFTGSETLARRAAEEIPVGILNINGSTTGSELHVPFGGMKASSGPGPREQGMTARDFYTDVRAVYAAATR
ncbi:MAG: aldehyde dehydrogenase family protein, partial [Streptosporangiaceae bacterium]